ncbi:MAG: membrane protein insertase YidC [Sedimentisphaerales bacterium]
MNFKTLIILILTVFCLLCGGLVVQSGFFSHTNSNPCILLQNTTTDGNSAPKVAAAETPALQPAPQPGFSAVGGNPKTITLGSLDPNTGFKFMLDLTSRGAAIDKATLSEFDDRDHKNPQPLAMLSPTVNLDGTPAFSMASRTLTLDNQLQFSLDKLDWITSDIETSQNGPQIARFEAIIKNKTTGQPAIKLIKTYRVTPKIYDLDCDLTVENLSSDEHKIQFELTGPAGIKRDDPRTDSRKTIAAFMDTRGEVISTILDISKLKKAATPENRQLVQQNAGFLWAAITCKYFTAIVIPTPDANMNFCNWITDKSGWFANPDGDYQLNSGDETIGLDLRTTNITLAPAGNKTFNFKLFLGPKDKSLFDKVPMYKNLGFVQTMDFMACCCPAAVIHPLAFGILWTMKWLYSFIPNYGVVIIILVLLVRLILHPLTRLSQVSMSKYAKFNALPEVQEIRKQYGKNMMEMNRRIGEVQKKYGVSHSAAVMGMLPTMVQMPIWIALYGAVYASIDLRGAQFLPFWITDLSAPDALFRFKAIVLPLFGTLDSFNLLPILMGVAFYLQQKLMPTQVAADPQAAQQQKIMMFMMPVMFPLMLYNSPSGLNLYIMASVFGGVIEQYIIKKHIAKQELLETENFVPVTSKTGGKVKKQKPKPFFKM